MTLKQAIKWVGRKDGFNATRYGLAKYLKVSPSLVYGWDKVPEQWQYKLHVKSQGELRLS